MTIGGNLSVAVGPLGRNAEGSGAISTKGKVAAMYSYSKTKGLFGGMSVEGTVIAERQDANRLAYGGNPTVKQILTGSFDPPDWAYVLIDALDSATGIPGGHQWVNEPVDDGAMGWSSPRRNGGNGYAFGEGVGAGGTATSRKRSSSLFSLGGNKDRSTQAAMFNGRDGSPLGSGGNSPAHTGSASPSRPWEVRRASSYLPSLPLSNSMKFGGTKTRERRATGPSSESYNADYDSQYAAAQRREGAPKRPYGMKATPSPFASELDNSPRSSPPRSTSDSSQHSPKEENLLSWDSRPTLAYEKPRNRARSGSAPRELLGSWDTDTQGLTTNFAHLQTNGDSKHTPGSTPSRSRAASNLPPFDERVEVEEYVQQRIQRDRRERSGSRDPFGRSPQTRDEYTRRDRSGSRDPFSRNSNYYNNDEFLHRNNRNSGSDHGRSSFESASYNQYNAPKPQLAVRSGLDAVDGHARAIAIYEFKGGQDGDLAFKKGQILTVLDAVGDGEWWRGRAVGGGGAVGEGMFPASYVEVLDIPRDLKGGVSRSLLKTRVLGLDDFE